jgi:hypothetical protein
VAHSPGRPGCSQIQPDLAGRAWHGVINEFGKSPVKKD